MVQKVIKKIIERRHFWRTVGFDELSEIYTSQMLRSLAASLVGIFVPVYLYKIGYSLIAISCMFLVWFMVRPLWAYVSARIIGAWGPKHAIAVSVILQIAYLGLILSIETISWPLWFVGTVGSLCYGLYMMAFQVDFSKIKHTEHGGKEIGFLQIFERIGAVLGPLIGGLLATIFDPRYTIGLAIAVLVGSLVPIFLSKEPTKTNQRIIIQGFPWRRHRRDFVVSTAFILENVVSITIWPLFLGVFVITANVYAVLGILTAVSTAVALVAILAIGKLIDKQYGKRLLNVGAYINAGLHLLRPFVTTAGQAFGISLINEPVTAMYRMPFMKGRFDASDSVPGYRIVYFMLVEWVNAVGNIIFWAIVVTMLAFWPDKLAFQATFVIGAILSICITRQRFAALE